MNFDVPITDERESAPDFFEKHQKWLEETLENYSKKLRGISLKALMVLTLITFGEQEIQHLGKDNAYDFKKYIMIGLNQKQKEIKLSDEQIEYPEDIDETNVH